MKQSDFIGTAKLLRLYLRRDNTTGNIYNGGLFCERDGRLEDIYH